MTLLIAAPARALNVIAVYRTACDRELGVILKSERRSIFLLRLDGTIVEIPRHEIASLAYYPVSRLPFRAAPTGPKLPTLKVETLYQGRVVELINGWPVDYSDTKISFLLRNGEDMVLDKKSIWSLLFDDGATNAAQPPSPTPAVSFAHPQTAGFCADEDEEEGERRVFAQQILNDKIVIRRELDRLKEGYEALVTLSEDQKFYPVPYVYGDRTSLGIWASFASRQGASVNRSNNFTPMLIDERAFGPFRYQHVFVSGNAPSEMLLHHEAQSQVYYRFKVAYFHAAVFVDPNLVLVGSGYNWKPADLSGETLDDRLNEYAGVEFGFDYGAFALELSPIMGAQSAVKVGTFFDQKQDHNVWRVGARLAGRTWEVKLTGGVTSRSSYYSSQEDSATSLYGDTDWKYRYARWNLKLRPSERLELSLSTIARTLDYTAHLQAGSASPPTNISYQSLSVSSALEGWLALGRRFRVGGHAIFEYQSRRADGSDERRLLPRLGLFTSFSF